MHLSLMHEGLDEFLFNLPEQRMFGFALDLTLLCCRPALCLLFGICNLIHRWVVRDGKLVEIGEEPPARGFFSRAADRFREGKLKHIESAYNATAKLPRTDLSGL